MIGVQLYSLREMAGREGPEAVFRAAAESGFDGVEFAGFYGLSPEEIGALLQKYNLTAMSAHIGVSALEEQLPFVRALKIPAVYMPCPGPEDLDSEANLTAFTERMRACQTRLAPLGVRYGYHNHYMEYRGEGDLVARFLEALPGLTAELDVFWAQASGRDPVALMQKYGDRLSCLHIKELSPDGPEAPNPVVGEGAVDMPAVFAQAARMGVQTFVLEAERFDIPERDYLARSCAAMKKLAGA